MRSIFVFHHYPFGILKALGTSTGIGMDILEFRGKKIVSLYHMIYYGDNVLLFPNESHDLKTDIIVHIKT